MKKNVVIALFPKGIEESEKSHINSSLEKVLAGLRKEAEEVDVAFVFGEKIVNSEGFQNIQSVTRKSAEPVKAPAKLSNIWLMALAQLEVKAGEGGKNVLIFITDNRFNKRETDLIFSAPVVSRFKDLEVSIVLIKSEDSGGGKLESYIKEHGKVYLETNLRTEAIL